MIWQDCQVSIAVDHLILCAPDLSQGADEIRRSIGASSVEGGRHVGFGTHNRIVPLGANYLELLAVADPAEALGNSFGAWATERSLVPVGVDALCLRVPDLDDVCERLGISATPMSRGRPDGVELSWRVAGIEETVNRGLPFFIEWAIPEAYMPGMMPVDHLNGPISLTSITVSGDASFLTDWIGEAPGVEVVEGPRGLTAEFTTPRGRVKI